MTMSIARRGFTAKFVRQHNSGRFLLLGSWARIIERVNGEERVAEDLHHVFRYDSSRYQVKKFPASGRDFDPDNFRLRYFDAVLCWKMLLAEVSIE